MSTGVEVGHARSQIMALSPQVMKVLVVGHCTSMILTTGGRHHFLAMSDQQTHYV